MKPTGIEWVRNNDNTQGFTWNPVVGCRHGCEWCYARKMARRQKCPKCKAFEPHMHWHRGGKMSFPQKKATTIFVGSMCDLWGDWIDALWIKIVLDEICEYPQHRFLTLTKNPKRYLEFDLPENLWCGVTITKTEDVYARLGDISRLRSHQRFISFEPLLDDAGTSPHFDESPFYDDFDWLIVGPLNGDAKRGPVTKAEWVFHIMDVAAKTGVPVFLKDAFVKHRIFNEEFVKAHQQVPWIGGR